MFNQPVDALPSSLLFISFGNNFNQRVDHLPPHLLRLSFQHSFNQSMNQCIIFLLLSLTFPLVSALINQLIIFLLHSLFVSSLASNTFLNLVLSLCSSYPYQETLHHLSPSIISLTIDGICPYANELAAFYVHTKPINLHTYYCKCFNLPKSASIFSGVMVCVSNHTQSIGLL